MFNIFKIFRKFKIETAKGPDGKFGARAYERTNKDGENETVIIGEKYPLRGHARGSVLHGKLGLLKDIMKEGLKVLGESEKDMIPQENLKLPVRAFAEVCDILAEAEENYNLRKKWIWTKKAGCHFMEEDDAYCYRYQLFMELMFERMKQIKLSKGDMSYFFGPGSKGEFDYKNEKILKHLKKWH